MIRVALIDARRSFVDAFRLLLESSRAHVEVVGTATDPSNALQLVQACTPDVVLLEANPPKADAMAALARLSDVPDPPRLLVLSSSSDLGDVRRAFCAGAHGYLTKDDGASTVVAGIEAVVSGVVVLSNACLPALRIPAPAPRPISLNARQLALLEFVARGACDSEMTAELHMSRATLHRELQQCVRRLAARNRTHAAVIAARSGWI